MRTLAIDASSKSSGIAIFEDEKLSYYECIKASQTDSLKRIKKMAKRIEEIYKEYKPTDIIMQQVLPEDVKHNQNVYKILIYLQAAVVLCLHQYQVKVNFYAASHWRKVCGIKLGPSMKRQSLKEASQQLVKSIYKIDVNDDISDAICLGIAYVVQHKSAF